MLHVGSMTVAHVKEGRVTKRQRSDRTCPTDAYECAYLGSLAFQSESFLLNSMILAKDVCHVSGDCPRHKCVRMLLANLQQRSSFCRTSCTSCQADCHCAVSMFAHLRLVLRDLACLMGVCWVLNIATCMAITKFLRLRGIIQVGLSFLRTLRMILPGSMD